MAGEALSSDEITEMRADIAEVLPDTAIIRRGTATPDGQGGYTEAHNPIGTVAARVAPITGQEAERGDRVSAAEYFTVAMPALTDVKPADEVEIASTIYRLTAVHDRGQWELTMRADAVAIDRGGETA